MAEVRWLRRALAELDAIAAFIALDAPPLAKDFAERAFRATAYLARFPLAGRQLPEKRRRTDLREAIFGNYRLIYRVRGELVEVLSIQHGARRLANPEKPTEPPAK